MRVKKYKSIKNERIGEIVLNYQEKEMVIIEYNNNKDITIQFILTKEIVKTAYKEFRRGKIKSHLSPTVFEIGVTGIAPIVDENCKQLKSYTCWCNMLKRCYSDKYQEKHPTYIGCIVSEDFKIYGNFKKFYDKNYYEILELGRTDLDKDILHKYNKIYSEDNCVFAPQAINKLFVKKQNSRGDFPIGVVLHGKSYQSICHNRSGIRQHLGTFTTPKLAFNAYKEFKESLIKQTAEKYKSQLPIKLYEALMNYTVEITD